MKADADVKGRTLLKKAKTAKYLRLENDKESHEGYKEEAKVKEPEADNGKDL